MQNPDLNLMNLVSLIKTRDLTVKFKSRTINLIDCVVSTALYKYTYTNDNRTSPRVWHSADAAAAKVQAKSF